jgi:crossover junction endodeoxyribonuclease RusA
VIEIDICGRPAPKGSRLSKVSKAGHSYTFPASKYEKPWVDAVKEQTQIVMRHHPTPAPPYAVELEFRLHKPHNARYDYPPAPDIDKLARAVIDGLEQGGALSNDKHVTSLTVNKRYIEPGEQPGVHTRISSFAAAPALAV